MKKAQRICWKGWSALSSVPTNDREPFEARLQRWRLLRETIQDGLDDIERGHVAPLDVEEIKQRGRQRLAERNVDWD